MSKLSRVSLLLIPALLSSAAYAESSCGEESTRKLSGPSRVTAVLYKRAQETPNGSWKTGEFKEELFTYIGSYGVGKEQIHLTQIKTIWGASSCRQTDRLMVWGSNYEYLGQYSSVSMPVTLDKNGLCIGKLKAKCTSLSSGIPAKLSTENDEFNFSKP